MTKLKNQHWMKIFKIFVNDYKFSVRHYQGSHILLGHVDGRRVTIVRANPIKIGTLRSMLKQAGISVDGFEKKL